MNRNRRLAGTLLPIAFLLAHAIPTVAQVDLLLIDHPATAVLLRLSNFGAIPSFPAEHLPISRRDALRWIDRGLQDSTLPNSMRREAEWYRVELRADIGEGRRGVIIPVTQGEVSVIEEFPDHPPFTGVQWVDTLSDSRALLDPVLDGEIRNSSGDLEGTTGIVQGGVRLRGSVRSLFGFSATATNGTVLGSEELARDDPRYGNSFKFGLYDLNRDIDFGSGHARFDLDGVAAGIGREKVQLGVGGESTLLFGAPLPSNTDWMRISFNVGSLRYTHIHAALFGGAPEGAESVGPFADIPTRYFAAHLLSLGPVGGVRLSVGEGVIYGGRPIEIGYLNPLNFLKSQEHYLRDRDNSLLYAGAKIWPTPRITVEAEFILDDLVFSRIGTGYWGNKTAWRIGLNATGVPVSTTDLELEYTRLEPYVYSHFSSANAFVHDGALPAAGGNEPNSHALQGTLVWRPLPYLHLSASLQVSEHGANLVADTGVVRNVGGDVREGFRREVSADTVEFLDGLLEQRSRVGLEIDYEIVRNVYLRLRGFFRSLSVEEELTEETTQVWFGMRIGAF